MPASFMGSKKMV